MDRALGVISKSYHQTQGHIDFLQYHILGFLQFHIYI